MKICPAFATLRVAILAILFFFPPMPCQALFRDNDLSTPEWQRLAPDGRVSSAGDVNGDGYSDFVVPRRSGVGFLVLEVYFGSMVGPPATASQVIDLSVIGIHWGSGDGSPVGDCNGDGYDDLIITDMGYGSMPDRGGVVQLYVGSASGLSTSPAWSYEPSASGFYIGWEAAPVGDMNGDYSRDFMVKGRSESQGHFREFLTVFSSSSNGLSITPGYTISADHFPYSFGGAGDIDGDGYDDAFFNTSQGFTILYGRPDSGGYRSSTVTGIYNGRGLGDINGDGFADMGATYPPDVCVFFGREAGISGLAETVANERIPHQQSGPYDYPAISPTGDLNGDGISDFAVLERGNPSTGFLYFGRTIFAGGAWAAAGQVPLGVPSNVPLFRQVGDVNGDGLSDIIAIDISDLARLYCGAGRPPLSTADVMKMSFFPSGGVAGAVCPAGDVNGDGYEDVLAGTPMYSHGQVDEGRAALYFGSPGGFGVEPGWTFESNQPYALFGSALCSAGDLNGDGYGDFAVGAYNHSNAVYIEGSIFVFYGGPGGVVSGPEIISGGQLGSAFGFALAALHDSDEDGFDDLAVGAYAHDGTAPNEGAVFVFKGSLTGLQPTPSQTLHLGTPAAGFGYAISFAGDVNGDGEGDLIVGAPFSSAGAPNGGAAYLFLGNGSGLASSPASIIVGTEANAHLGQAVCGLGDSDGDGLSDVAVAAPNAAGGGIDRGRVTLYPGNPFGLAITPSSQVVGAADHAEWGGCILGPGDINADGLSDLAVIGTGTPCAASAYLCGVGCVVTSPAWSAYVGPAYPILASASGPSDLNGDGVGDIVLPSPGATDGFTAYYGNAAPAIAHFSQARGVAGPNLNDGGVAAGPNYLQIRADARSAAGRAQVRLEFEGKSRPQPFDGLGTKFSGLRLTGPAGGANGSAAEFSEVLTGLPFQSQIKWRVRTRSRNPYFPTSPWRERPMTRMVGWTARTPCETCISAVPEPPSRGPLTRAVQVVGNPVAPRGRALALAVWSAAQGDAVLEILDVTGRLVSTQDVRLQADTWNDAEIQRRALPGASGVYFIRLRAPWGIDSRRVVIE